MPIGPGVDESFVQKNEILVEVELRLFKKLKHCFDFVDNKENIDKIFSAVLPKSIQN